jgi:large subunit ribosomal protein L10
MRPEKANIVSDLSEKLNRSPFVLVTDYQRMNVNHFADLRNRLAASGAEVHVVKNSFLRRAISDSGLPDVAEKLTGQTAVVTGVKDAAPVAKILKTFSAEFKIAALKIGIIDKAVLSTQEVEALADLPSREVLLAKLLGLFLSPATKLARVLNEPGSAFARILNAKAKSMPAEPAPMKAEQPKAEDVKGGRTCQSGRVKTGRAESGGRRVGGTNARISRAGSVESGTNNSGGDRIEIFVGLVPNEQQNKNCPSRWL